MRYYPHTTIVRRMQRMQRERRLPKEGEIVAGIGQEVSPVQVVARTPKETKLYIIHASKLLQIDPEELPQYLQVDPQSAIDEGMLLLRKRGFPRAKTYHAPISGTLYGIRNGRLILEQRPDWLELRAMVQGRIVNLIPNWGVVLEIKGSLVQAVWGSGKEGVGKLKVVVSTADAPLAGHQLNAETAERILVVGKVADAASLTAAEENGIGGLIAGSMTAELCEMAHSLSFPIILTDGIGDFNMASPIFQLLQQSEEYETTLFTAAAYHTSAGGAAGRPEIIIPLPGTPQVEGSPTLKPLAVGQPVRVLRAPYHNQVGEIKKLYTLTQTTEIMTKVHGADVKLSDGRIVFIPYVNIDSIV